ncbi:TetR/AcrR family transcriptional regulator [uncultured Clostridium sp.]|uniref:TetR/AcrR family transcriptional regulator n=1 Tax=uncultured Clostridium sp. TaxID=59620 RepID=UPI0028EF9982|nr:TetR/AcrR family transcriptional regulator [uncultured Clostridium sp.]
MKIPSKKNDLRVIRTRKLIEDAFLSLSKEKDFEAITVKDIADKAAVNRTTFYTHFVDKYALLDNLFSETFTNLLSERIKSDATLTEETLKELIFIVCDYNDSLNSQCKRIYRSASTLMDSKMQLKLQDIVKNLLMKGITSNDVDIKKIETYAIMISSSIYFATSHWYKEDESKDISALVTEILAFVMTGIEVILEKNILNTGSMK